MKTLARLSLAFIPTLLLTAACGGGGSSASPAGDTAASGSDAVVAASLDDTVSGETLLADGLLDDLSADGAVYDTAVTVASVAGEVAATDVAPSLEPPLREAVLPVAWGRRRIGPPDRTVTIDQSGDTAHVTVESRIDGRLYVDTSDDGIRNPGAKPFAHTLHRTATFERDGGGWHLTAISPSDIVMSDASRQTVTIEKVAATVGGEVVAEITDPAAELAVPEGFPTLQPGDAVVVAATVSHEPGSVWVPDTFVFLHHGGHRDRMVDDGTGADEVAGDGVYTGRYTIGDRSGRRLAVVDALDSVSLQNETDDDYAAHGWAVPYRVVRTDVGSDEAAVRALVAGEGLLAPLAPFDHLAGRDDETAATDGSGLPAHWGRRPTGPRARTVDVHIANGVAEVTVHGQWPGRLYVDTSFDGIFNPGVKPTDETAVHHLRYVKTGGRWHLDALSLGEIDLTDPARQTVAITAITVQKGSSTAYEITDPAALQPVGDGLFTVGASERVTVTAQTAQTDTGAATPPPYLFLHGAHHRRLMVDDGTHGDAVAGDGIYTARFIAGHGRGHRRFVVDAIAQATLQNEIEDDYDSNRWVVPYRVVRPTVVDRLPFHPQPQAMRRLERPQGR